MNTASLPSRLWQARRALLWRWPDRRGLLLMPPILIGGMLGVLWYIREVPVAQSITLFVLEAWLPALIGLAVSGALAGDSSLDMVLCAPYPTGVILLGRVALPLIIGGLLGGLSQWLLTTWKIPLAQLNPFNPLDQWECVLIWAAPMVLFSGIGLTGSMLGGSLMQGIQAIIGLVAGAFVLIPVIRQRCPTSVTEPCQAALFHPLLTMLRPSDPQWALNRLIWIGIGLALLCAGGWLSRRSEWLLAASAASMRD